MKKNPPNPHRFPKQTKPARLALRDGFWVVDGARYPSWRTALAAALEKADIGPQPGNSEQGSRRVFERRLAKAAGV